MRVPLRVSVGSGLACRGHRLVVSQVGVRRQWWAGESVRHVRGRRCTRTSEVPANAGRNVASSIFIIFIKICFVPAASRHPYISINGHSRLPPHHRTTARLRVPRPRETPRKPRLAQRKCCSGDSPSNTPSPKTPAIRGGDGDGVISTASRAPLRPVSVHTPRTQDLQTRRLARSPVP